MQSVIPKTYTIKQQIDEITVKIQFVLCCKSPFLISTLVFQSLIINSSNKIHETIIGIGKHSDTKESNTAESAPSIGTIM